MSKPACQKQAAYIVWSLRRWIYDILDMAVSVNQNYLIRQITINVQITNS